MKSNMVKKLLSLAAVATLIIGGFTGCASSSKDANTSTDTNVVTEAADAAATEAPAVVSKGGTIMWLSNLTSGIAYDCAVNYATSVCKELGYEFQVVYGDMFNDPAANLNAVKNAMTKDVVAIIASQDGGIKDIMAEYPELYVAGYNTDMLSVYGDGGANAEAAANEKFLGTICDGHYDGTLTGKQNAKAVIEKGYKKVATITFPGYAYPNLPVADQAFRAEIEAYNTTAADADKITVVGEAKVLEFAPLEESYFLEDGYGDLDAIVGFCAGTDFIYPTMKSAIANGSCSPATKLITGGFNTDEAIVADIGGDGVIQYIGISPSENLAWSITMLDNALNGNMYSDYTASERVDSLEYVIDSKEDIDNVMTKSMTGTADVTKAQITMDDLKKVLTRFTPDATYADLNALFHSEQLSVDALASK